jgi:hypothetical protein
MAKHRLRPGAKALTNPKLHNPEAAGDVVKTAAVYRRRYRRWHLPTTGIAAPEVTFSEAITSRKKSGIPCQLRRGRKSCPDKCGPRYNLV